MLSSAKCSADVKSLPAHAEHVQADRSMCSKPLGAFLFQGTTGLTRTVEDVIVLRLEY